MTTTGDVAGEDGRHATLIDLDPVAVELALATTMQGGLVPAAGGAR